MNFTPPLRPYQLLLPFAGWPEFELVTPWERAGLSRSTYFGRRRLRRVAARAFELGKRRAAVFAEKVHYSALPIPSRESHVRPFYPTRGEAGELEALAARVARLSISRTDPHAFFEARSQISYEICEIARRGNQGRTTCRG